MKLRLRSLESRETLKLELPNSSTIHDLKQALALSLSLSSLPLHLSLNRKDELRSSAPADADSLEALGITSGDLIFYTSQPNAFAVALPREAPPIRVASSQEPITQPESQPLLTEPMVALSSMVDVDCTADVPESGASSSVRELKSSGTENLLSNETLGHEMIKDAGTEDEGKKSDLNLQSSDVLDETQLQKNYLDGNKMDVDVEIDGSAAYKYSEPYFLRRVLREESRDDVCEHRLLVIAVHAVMLESGFVAFDSLTGNRVDRFHLPAQCPPTAFTISLRYTLPDLLDNGSNAVESVVLKFQRLGHFLNVYGSLAKGKTGLHRVCLDEYKFAPTIDLMWASCYSSENRNDMCSSVYPDSEVFEFWKISKDGLALPLLIDLCERANLSLPSCFMCLPTELKLQIFELLPGSDLATVGCVSSELRYLSSNSDLWKKKFVEEFGVGPPSNFHWKVKFSSYWEARKKRKRERSMWIGRAVAFPGFHRDPNPPMGVFPNFIGGDYDRFPGFGVPPPLPYGGRPGGFLGIRRNVRSGCNLGGGRNF